VNREQSITPVSVLEGQSQLLCARKACQICVKKSPGRIRSGASFNFDPPVVSYWSQWLGCTEPKILVVGQDFGDTGYFQRFSGSDDPENKTNKNLYQLLVHAGLTPTCPPKPDRTTPVYLTNSVLCLKEPPMNAPLLNSWIRACAENHLRPLAQLLKPPIIVAMGGPGWMAVKAAFRIDHAPGLISIAAGGSWKTNGSEVFAVGHCSGLGIRNRPWHTQLEDWSRVGDALKRIH
jgi:hypothetical protein